MAETTSKDTQSEDTEEKKGLYERLGVEEYLLFDPLGEYLRPRLQGYRLVDGRYERLAPEADGSLLSRTTGLRLAPEGRRLRLRDAATGEPLLWDEEQVEARRAAEERAETAEERIRLLEEELARLRRNQPDR
jgi:putative restriction endonuclease